MRLTLCTVLALNLAACGGRQDEQHTWKDRMSTVDCTPRTARAQAELGACPRLAHFPHPTLAEQAEIVRYLNRKNQIEGTIVFGDFFPPGCLTWTVDPANDVPRYTEAHKPGCGNDFQQKLRDFSIPGPAATK
jgi:hypothetical protein